MRLTGILALLIAPLLLALAGCNESNRPLSYDKGVYGGKPDAQLTSEQVEELRQRGMRTYQ